MQKKINCDIIRMYQKGTNEMPYKCVSTPTIECHKCKYYNECILSEILDVLTGNAPPIIDYPTPTQIIYAEGE